MLIADRDDDLAKVRLVEAASALQHLVEGDAERLAADAAARGEAEIGFQQISELLPISGAELVGPLPPEFQKITIFSAALTKDSKAREQAKALIDFLASAAAAPALVKSGMEPIAPAQ